MRRAGSSTAVVQRPERQQRLQRQRQPTSVERGSPLSTAAARACSVKQADFGRKTMRLVFTLTGNVPRRSEHERRLRRSPNPYQGSGGCLHGRVARCSPCPRRMEERWLKTASERRRILFVAHQACGNPALCAGEAHAERAADVHVVARPSSPLHRWTWTTARTGAGGGAARGERRLPPQAWSRCARHARRRRPVQAIADALLDSPPTRSSSAWRSRNVRTGFARVWSSARTLQVPVTELDVAAGAAALA